MGLLRFGHATAEQLAEGAYISASAIRQQLLALTIMGLVERDEVRQGPGRPKHVYRLSAKGEQLFPQATGALAHQLFAALAEEAEGVRRRVMDRLSRLFPFERLPAARDETERTHQALGAMAGAGYIGELREAGDQSELVLHHCPVFEVASRHPEICQAEQEALRRALPGLRISRSAHRLAGDGYCAYRCCAPRAEGAGAAGGASA